jgi:tRNA/rRNA methyltransferase
MDRLFYSVPAANVVVVLNELQREVNLGSTVRTLLNTGFDRLRLVAPAAYDPARIEDMAHRSAALVGRIEHFATIDSALADVDYVVGFSARHRADRRTQSLTEIGPLLRRLSIQAPLALLFGREDRGLDNAAVERCTHLVHIPTDPAYPSLNLADAVLLALYELRRAPADAPESTSAPLPATHRQMAATFDLIDQLLRSLRFGTSPGSHSATMRILRDLLSRAATDEREAALIQALCRKILRTQDPPDKT